MSTWNVCCCVCVYVADLKCVPPWTHTLSLCPHMALSAERPAPHLLRFRLVLWACSAGFTAGFNLATSCWEGLDCLFLLVTIGETSVDLLVHGPWDQCDHFSEWTDGSEFWALGTCRLSFVESYIQLPWGFPSSVGAGRVQQQHTCVPISPNLQYWVGSSLPFCHSDVGFPSLILFSSPLLTAFSTSAPAFWVLVLPGVCPTTPSTSSALFNPYYLYFSFKGLCCCIQLNYLL